MVRKLIFSICFLLVAKINLAQIACYDAQGLSKFNVTTIGARVKFDPKDSAKLFPILLNYVSPAPKSYRDLVSAFENNPFIGIQGTNSASISNAVPMNFSAVASSLGSTVGGLDVTTIADGLSQFIVERTKEELNISFFTKFQEILADSNYRDLNTVFPSTCKLLQNIGTEIYNYDRYIQNLKETFTNDLKSLPKDLPGVIDNHPEIFLAHPKLEALLRSSFYVANSLHDQVHPGDVLADYPLQYLDSLRNPNFKGAIQTLKLISASLRDSATNDSATYWAPSQQIRKLVTNKIAFGIYLGLIYQQASNTPGGIYFRNDSLTGFLKKVAAEYNTGYNVYEQYKTYVLGFSEKASALDKMIRSYKKSSNDSLNVELFAEYCTSSIDLMEYSTGIGDLPIIKESNIGNLHKEFQPYFSMAYSTANLVTDIDRKNYSSAINNTLQIIAVINDSADDHKLDAMINKLTMYGSFISSVATAKTSDDVEAAIEAFALPSGSSRIKRESLFNVSVNAYCGLYAGYEQIQKLPSDNAIQLNGFGVAAPVGVSISMGHRKFFWIGNDNNKHWSYTAFVSIIDLGAIAAYRFNSDTNTAQIPKVQLKDIISPGLFFSLGIPKCPISLNMGAQLGPNLRNVNQSGNTYSNEMYIRYSFSVLVDIPVLNLYTKSTN
jgi:hypothetical protein